LAHDVRCTADADDAAVARGLELTCAAA
jgi:hypothetical protein